MFCCHRLEPCTRLCREELKVKFTPCVNTTSHQHVCCSVNTLKRQEFGWEAEQRHFARAESQQGAAEREIPLPNICCVCDHLDSLLAERCPPFFSLFPNCCCTAIQHAELLSCNHFANLGSGGARRAVPRFTGRRQISAWELSSFLSAYDHCHHHRHACSSSSLSSLSLMANALLSLPRTGYSHLPRKKCQTSSCSHETICNICFFSI